jgi:ribosomal protein S18 acetylase RimI-like enzyme
VSTLVQTTDQIILKNTPNIPGLIFRKFRGEPDFEAMAAISNAANQADGDDELTTVEDIRNTYAHLQRSDPDTDMIFAEFEGQAVGYGRCMWGTELNGDYLYSFFVNQHPDWRGDDIPLAMIEFLQERLIEIAAQHPPEAPKYFQTWGAQDAQWHVELMDQLGLNPVRYGIMMTRPCKEPVEVNPLPAGIEVRPVGPEDYRKVFDADAEAFRDHWGYVPPTETDYQRWLNSSVFDPSIWKVAWEGDQIVCMVLNFIDHKENQEFDRKRGYTENICVLRPWRRQGVARSLLSQSIQMFQEMGMEETALGVDTNNPNGALGLYTSVGYQELKRFVTYRAQIV